MLSIRPDRWNDLRTSHCLINDRAIAMDDCRDVFGNICKRTTLPIGYTRIACDFVVEGSGAADQQSLNAIQHEIETLPADILMYLVGSRHCDTDLLSNEPGGSLAIFRPAGSACRQLSISCTVISLTATHMRARPEPHGEPIRRRSAFAGILLIWLLPFAAA